jgi:hypothetical protein
MRAEQAVFTSARTSKSRGYHLISQSPGIDDEQARSLIRWCPSHAGLASAEPDTSSLNFHPVTDGTLALSRTVYGGAEYSARGGLQIVTRILLVRDSALSGYQNDPATFARVAMALGHLRLDPNVPNQLPEVELPDRPLRVEYPSGDGAIIGLVVRLQNLLDEDKRVAVVGDCPAIRVLVHLFPRLPERKRLDITFTTGLKPSMHRAFRVHFLPSVDPATQHQLASQGITLLNWNMKLDTNHALRHN